VGYHFRADQQRWIRAVVRSLSELPQFDDRSSHSRRWRVGALAGAGIGSVLPGLGTAVGAAVGAVAVGTYASVLSNSDIVMSTESNLRHRRATMSHEYGHYMFCNMLYDANEDAVDHVVWGTVVEGNEINFRCAIQTKLSQSTSRGKWPALQTTNGW